MLAIKWCLSFTRLGLYLLGQTWSNLNQTSTCSPSWPWLQVLFWKQAKFLNKIMRTRHANLMMLIFRLRIILTPKTAADSNFEPQIDSFPSWTRIRSLNKVCCTQPELQLLLIDQGLDQLVLQDTKLQSGIPETKLHYDLAKFSEIQNSTLWNLGSSIWLG
jgi:hypothetical protein